MNRREAISSVAFLLGGSVLGSQMFILSGCSSDKVNDLFTEKDVALMDEIAETIIPRTHTPGAKDAKTGAFMAVMIKDCYTAEDQAVFIEGLKKINELSKEKYSEKFIDCTAQQKHELLESLDTEQKEHQKNKGKKEPKHYFRMMKELTLLGYFTSEEGGTKQLTYVEVPGRYDACIPYKKGDPVYLIP